MSSIINWNFFKMVKFNKICKEGNGLNVRYKLVRKLCGSFYRDKD